MLLPIASDAHLCHVNVITFSLCNNVTLAFKEGKVLFTKALIIFR